ncbi:MAG: PAS domain-containing protein [Anaerolineae bacterium]|nr:PAS domain-containing protein [Anaerolineae bacterium]
MAGQSILVIEPDLTLSKTISEQILLPHGFKPLLAQNQAEGLRIALTEAPRLLLLHLPVTASINLLRDLALVANHPFPVILITDQALPQLAVELLRLGVRDCLTCPLAAEEVLPAIHRALGQEQAETDRERFSLLMSVVDEAVWMLDPNLKVIAQNKAAGEIFGWPPAEAIGKSICELLFLHNHTTHKLCQLLNQAIEKQQPLFDPKVLLKTKENRSILVRSAVTPLLQNSRVIGILCVLQRTPNDQYVRLEFANMAAHLLRNPLSFIQTCIDLLMSSDLDPQKQQTTLKSMWERSQWLTKFTDELLNMLRLEAGEVRIYVESVAITPLIEQILLLVQDEENLRHQFNLVAADNLPLVAADPTKTELILFNLLTNAVNRCPAGGQVAIEAEANQSEVIISIIDNGEPIPPKLLDRIFGQFYPVDDENGKMPSTYELGLYTTKRLVELQNGRIWATSQPGQGSRFCFSLPFWEQAS